MQKTKFFMLLSLDNTKYPNKKVRFDCVSDIHAYVDALLSSGAEVVLAQKTADVEYEICKRDNVIVDTFALVNVDGYQYKLLETVNIANSGDFLIRKNGGLAREYCLKMPTALKRYTFDVSKTKGTAHPIEKMQKFVRVDHNIAFVSPWGEWMYLCRGGYLNITGNRYYAIQKYSFDHTYTIQKSS